MTPRRPTPSWIFVGVLAYCLVALGTIRDHAALVAGLARRGASSSHDEAAMAGAVVRLAEMLERRPVPDL